MCCHFSSYMALLPGETTWAECMSQSFSFDVTVTAGQTTVLAQLHLTIWYWLLWEAIMCDWACLQALFCHPYIRTNLLVVNVRYCVYIFLAPLCIHPLIMTVLGITQKCQVNGNFWIQTQAGTDTYYLKAHYNISGQSLSILVLKICSENMSFFG